MKAMFMSDMLTAKKYFISQALMGLVIGIFLAMVMENIYIIVPCVGCMTSFSVAFTLLAFDERNDWQQFRLALPISRSNVMLGRYASLAMITLGGMVVGLVTFALVVLVVSLFPSVPIFQGLLDDLGWQTLLFAFTVSIALMLFMLAITLPLVARMGMTKAVRFIPIIIVIAIPALMSLGAKAPSSEFVTSLLAWVATDAGIIIASIVSVCATLLLYAASCALSVKLYATREL